MTAIEKTRTLIDLAWTCHALMRAHHVSLTNALSLLQQELERIAYYETQALEEKYADLLNEEPH